MKAKFLGSRANKLLFEINNLQLKPGQVEIKPHFVRNVKKINEDESKKIYQLTCEIKPTQDAPIPFTIFVDYSAVYEVDFENQYEERSFMIDVTKQLYATIRTVIINLTSNAGINAVLLPMQANSIFPEDEEIDMASTGI